MSIYNTNQPGKPQQILPAVAAAIFNDKGEVLLQKRKDVDQWAVISGHVEFGETIENAILREIEEETNVKATLVRFIGVYSSPDSQTYFYKDKTVQYITSYFEARLAESIPADFSNEETGELKFFSPDSLPKNLAPMDKHWLSDALTKNEPIRIR
ncbi:MAG: NUDIX domain-containing protein [Bacteroidota bacterium]